LGSNFQITDFREAVLEGAIFEKANFEKANLSEVNSEKADFKGSNFEKANLSLGNFREADFTEASMEGATFAKAQFEKAYLIFANFKSANFYQTNLKGASLQHANFDETEVIEMKYNRSTQCRGIRVGRCHGSQQFNRFAKDQDFLEEFKSKGKKELIIYYTWLTVADCGRTPWRWIFWSVLLALYFGLNFFFMGPQAFKLDYLEWNFSSMIYYSVVTFTTLGFGDIKPLTNIAAWWVMAEVIVGYIMLGGLISILATILARRS
jgi:hypothetical protein